MIKKDEIQETLLRLCKHYGEQNWWQSDNKLEDLVSTILIQRTTEKNAKLALSGLMDVMTVEGILDLSLEELQERIRPAGFFKQKSQTIRGLLIWLREVGGFEVLAKIGTEDLRKQLLELKGIGPETADALLLYLFDHPVFISDEYARRLFRRLGFGNFKTYSEMHAVYGNVLEGLTLKQCQEIHAVIDEHGKAFSKSKGQLDESWLR
ncbi:endonuclease III domain-containing protein [Streptococcus sp. 27098_8_91]|uniref:endonuclease III domain-containing protein n=1 Tax=Streptococcus TaxID=1301 RepID=UPI00352C54B4